jgi:hypothetical protein
MEVRIDWEHQELILTQKLKHRTMQHCSKKNMTGHCNIAVMEWQLTAGSIYLLLRFEEPSIQSIGIQNP